MSKVLLTYPFRPFFLLAALYAAAGVLGWTGYLFWDWPLELGASPVRWHAHEMLFGFLPAAIAGFLLTAMTNWTGAPPLRGRGLLALVLLWLAGRAAMWSAAYLPAWAVAAADLAFLPVLAVYAGRVLLRHGNRRNLPLAGVIGIFAFANLLFHLDALDLAGTAAAGERLAMNLITLLMVVIAGRITPAFTANWLRNHGKNPALVQQSPLLDRAAIAATAAMILVDPFAPALAGAAVALAACVLNGIRLTLWSGWHAWREPLLWILHLGYLWIVLALMLKGLAPFAGGIIPSAWLHAIGAGAAGTLIIGVMSRVSLGHTGRALSLPGFGTLMYLAVLAAGLLRVLAALGVTDYRLGVTVSSIFWAVGFLLFVLLYWPILSRPRVDGRSG